MRKVLIRTGAACLVGLAATPAAAQVVIEGQGVADRPRPDYDAVGSPFLGSWRAYPSIWLIGEATDNYLATDTNRRSDAYLSVVPEVYFKDNGGPNRLEAHAFFSQSVHANLPNENAASGGVSISSAYEPARDTQLRADISAAHYVESRSSLGAFQAAADPVKFEAYHAGLGVTHSFVDLSLGLNAALDRDQFHDTHLANGTPIDQDYRDVRTATVGATANYALRNGIGLVLSGSYVDERYDLRPGKNGFSPLTNIDRDSSGYNITGGVSLELTHLVFGTIQVGYLSRNYTDPRLNDFSGLSFSGDVLWNVTPLTSLRFRASRSVQDTSSTFIAGNTRSDFRVSVDHELYRYIILSGDAFYGHFSPNGPGIGGDEYSVGASARYLIDRRYSVSGGVRHSGRSSDAQALRYQANYLTLSFRAAF
ncbi:outer membrane beta-barrel protein [Sphingomonas sp.]|uniref:outer membrane beta-barrel protein n=1 Tax=Sphingomonas sp. TaxID=28214 RepID=UPI003CC6A899